MIKNGKYIMYSLHGVCQIVGQEERKDSDKLYYSLVPWNDKGAKLLVPVDNDNIRPVVSKEEAVELLNNVESLETGWITDNNLRANTYNQIVKSGDSREKLKILRSLLKKQREKSVRLTIQDRKIIENTERLLVSELAMVLELEEKEVRNLIMQE